MQVSCKCLLSLRLCTKLKARYNKKCWLMLAKRKMKSRTKDFPGGSKIDMGKSLSGSRIGACYLSKEKIRKAAEPCVKGFPVQKLNLWVIFQITRQGVGGGGKVKGPYVLSVLDSKIVMWVVSSWSWVILTHYLELERCGVQLHYLFSPPKHMLWFYWSQVVADIESSSDTAWSQEEK